MLKAGLRAVNKKLNEHGMGYEHVAKPIGKGGVEHYNEFKFGKLGKVDIPQGKIEYNRPKSFTPKTLEKPKQMKALMKQYGDKGYTPSTGKGVGY